MLVKGICSLYTAKNEVNPAQYIVNKTTEARSTVKYANLMARDLGSSSIPDIRKMNETNQK